MQSHDEEAKRLISNCHKRWLTAVEVLKVMEFLKNHQELVQKSLPFRPICGSIVAIDFDKKKSKWKEDGYEYEKRANDRGFKEHSEKIGEDKKLLCLYSSVASSDAVYKTIDHFDCAEIKMQRRIFRHPDLYPNLVLVQYFLSKKLKRPEDKTNDTSGDKK